MTATTSTAHHHRKATAFGRASTRLRKLAMYVAMAMTAGCEECNDTTAPTQPSFKLTVNPLLIDVAQGTSGQFTVTVQRNAFSGAVALDVPEPLPTGTTITFDPPVIPSGSTTSTATVTLTTDADVKIANGTPSTLTARVRGKAAGLDDRFGEMSYTPVLGANAGFTMNATPPTLTLRAGQSGDAIMMINRQGNFRGPITFKTTVFPAGNATATVTPIPGQTDSYLVHVDVPSTTSYSSDPIRVTIDGTSSGVRSRDVDLSVYVMDPSFRVRMDRDVRMRAGAQDTVTVRVQRGVWFSAPVTLSFENAPAGMTGTFATNPVDGGSMLTIRAAATVAPGTYNVRVRGTPPVGSGAIEATYTISAIVDPPLVANAYTMQAPNMSVVSGNFTSSIFNVTRANGFVDPITVNISRVDAQQKPLAMPTGMTVSLDQNPLTGSFTTIRLNTTSATPAGTYTFVATGVTASSNDVTSPFTITVTAAPVATSVSIGKLVSGTLVATTFETIAVNQIVQLRAVVLDQNGNPMSGETVTWTSQQPTTANIYTPQGDVLGFGSGTATVVATATSNNQVRKSIQVNVVAPPTTSLGRMVLEPGNAELTAPGWHQFIVKLYDKSDAKMNPEAGTKIEYYTSNPAIAKADTSTGIVTGVSSGNVTIMARYLLANGALISEASTSLFVYGPGSKDHYGSAYISTNNTDTRTIRVGTPLLFQLFVSDVTGRPVAPTSTLVPDIKPSNPNVTIVRSTITGGYYYNMIVGAGVAANTTFTVRYDIPGAGGEITMKVVP